MAEIPESLLRRSAEAKAKAHAIAQEASNKLKDEVAAERAALEKDLAARSAEAEKRISEAKMSALKDVNAVASETASEIVQRLIGVAPGKSEVSTAVAAARKE